MADDFDVEAMLEAPYRNQDEVKTSSSSDKHKKKKRSGSKDRKRSRSRDRERSKRDKSRRSRSRERRERRKSPPKRRSRERDSHRRKSRSPSPVYKFGRPARKTNKSRSRSPFKREPLPELTPEERDARTVFCMQLSNRIRPRDLEEFFSSVGKVRDVRLITDNKTRRSKGICYVEFDDTDSVPLALGLAGQKLLGVPIIVQPSQAEKNRLANAANNLQKGNSGPMRLYVGSLHFNITEEMLKAIFEPFGKVDDIKLIRDHDTSRSQGYGFVTFGNAEEAKKALEQLNGFEVAGRPMKVNHVTERTGEAQGNSLLDSDEMDRAGIDLGATGRLQLMAKLAEGTGFQIPQYAASALSMNSSGGGGQPSPQDMGIPPAPVAPPATAQAPAEQNGAAPPIATQCFMFSNMFDPTSESNPNWDQEIRDDVIEECNKHGGVLHIYVDKASPQGNVYVKCPSIAAAIASVNALHGRYFAGRIITAAYVPLPNYHGLFPDAMRTTQLLVPSTQMMHIGLPGGIVPTGMVR